MKSKVQTRHYLAISAAALIPVLVALGLYPAFELGFYAGALVCRSDENCLHEIGHKMNTEMGYPSNTKEFGAAITAYLAGSLKYGVDDYTVLILTQGGMLSYNRDYSIWGIERFSSPQSELYAEIYKQAGGDVSQIPAMFQPFYSNDPKYTDLYQCLMSARVKVCGAALHMEK